MTQGARPTIGAGIAQRGVIFLKKIAAQARLAVLIPQRGGFQLLRDFRIPNKGGAGDPPVPSGDPPDGTAESVLRLQRQRSTKITAIGFTGSSHFINFLFDNTQTI
jgi:hypothetical protein